MTIEIDFSDLEDGTFSAAPRTAAERAAATEQALLKANLQAPNETYLETCTACRGTGQFRSYSGRIVGQCFKCKGKGNKSFKSSPATRAAAADRRAIAKANILEEFNEWNKTPEADLVRWGVTKGMDFYQSVLNYAMTHGAPSEGQTESLRRTLAKNADRLAAKEGEKPATIACDVTKIQQAFDTARANFVQKPKMNLGEFTFSRAPDTGRNPGAIYVKAAEQYLGKIAEGTFYPVRECTEERKIAIAEVAQDPFASAIAYGFRTRNCAICSRSLYKEESVDRGIGPICAEKFGWVCN